MKIPYVLLIVGALFFICSRGNLKGPDLGEPEKTNRIISRSYDITFAWLFICYITILGYADSTKNGNADKINADIKDFDNISRAIIVSALIMKPLIIKFIIFILLKAGLLKVDKNNLK